MTERQATAILAPMLNPPHATHMRQPRPTPIGAAAADNLRYIRNAMEAARTFTTVPGKGCLIMGLVAIVAAGLESVPGLARHWLAIWLSAAVLACAAALTCMAIKARAEGLSLSRASSTHFFLTLAPAYFAGAVLTFALLDSVGRPAIAGIWLLLYGAGLSAGGVYSVPAVLVSGFAFMALGAAAFAVPPAWAPALLALGFGGIHIALGAVIVRHHGG